MKNKLPLFLIGLIITIFLWPVFFGKIPLPADALVGLYHPYRDYFATNSPNGVPYKNFLITDPIRQQFIWKKFAVEQLKRHEIPWWNPYTHSGMPFVANMQAGVFYPLNIIFWILPFIDAWSLFILSQSVLGGVFMYAYLRQQKLHSLACVLGTISFVFSGFFIVWWEWGNISHTILWLPAILWSIDRYISSHNTKYLILHTIFLSSSFFAGHLQTWFYLAIVSGIYALINIKSKLLVIGAWLLVIAITSIQWLPTLELIQLSARDIDQTQILTRLDWFIPWQHLIQIIAPDFFGNPATLNYWGVWNYAEFIGYIGFIPLVFAFSTLKNKLTRFWWGLIIIGLLFALPTPIAKIPFILKIPFLSQAQPSRLLSIISFALAVLSAYGFDYALKNNLKSLKYPLLVTGFILVTLWPIAIRLNLSVSQRNLILPSGLFAAMIIILQVSKLLKKRLLLSTYYLILLVSFADQLRFATKFTSFSPREYVFPETKVIKFLQSDPSLFRIMSIDRRILPPNVAMFYNLQTIEGYDPLYLKNYAQLITEMETGQKQDQPASFNRILSPTNLNSDIINKLNVKYIFSLNDLSQPFLQKVFQEGETRIYQNMTVLPRARLLTGTDPVMLKQYTPNKIILEVSAPTNTTLEVADMMYPGWKAYLDNQSIDINPSPENFRQVSIPAGKHQVIFSL